MGLRATPVPYTLVPALLVSAGIYWYLAEELRLDRFAAWLVAINLVVFPVWALDKLTSKRKGFRIPELTLHLIAAAGGAPASLAAMKLLRHKTRHRSFLWIYLALLVPWGALVFFWLSRP